MEVLQPLFQGRALTYEEFIKNLTREPSIKLANLREGLYVNRDKFHKREEKLKRMQAELQQLKEEKQKLQILLFHLQNLNGSVEKNCPILQVKQKRTANKKSAKRTVHLKLQQTEVKSTE